MSETPHNDAQQQALNNLVDAFGMEPSEDRTQAILAAYLEHDRARANALAGSINHLAVLFEQTTSGIAQYKDSQIDNLDQSLRRLHATMQQMRESLTAGMEPLIDRLHSIANQQMAWLELLYQQADYASQIDQRLASVEQQQQQLAEEQARIRRELADIRQQLAVGGA